MLTLLSTGTPPTPLSLTNTCQIAIFSSCFFLRIASDNYPNADFPHLSPPSLPPAHGTTLLLKCALSNFFPILYLSSFCSHSVSVFSLGKLAKIYETFHFPLILGQFDCRSSSYLPLSVKLCSMSSPSSSAWPSLNRWLGIS